MIDILLPRAPGAGSRPLDGLRAGAITTWPGSFAAGSSSVNIANGHFQNVCSIDIVGIIDVPVRNLYSVRMNEAPIGGNNEAVYEEIGKRIQKARTRQVPRKTQLQLAKAVGLERTSITNIEHGRQKILLHTFLRIASALDVSPETLLPNTSRETTGSGFNQSLPEGLPVQERRFIEGSVLHTKSSNTKKKR
jgi:transcriptional regulator with XRE-family HTH domain